MKHLEIISLNMMKRTYLIYDELEMLSILLEVEISIKESLNIIKNRNNEHLINKIINDLDNGLNINDIITNYIKSDIKDYIRSFVSYLPLKDSLDLALSIGHKENEFKNKVMKNLSYPLLLMSFSLVGIYLFNGYCFKPLINSFDGFNADLSHLINFKTFLDIFITLIFIILLFILSLILIISRKNQMVRAYTILQKYFKDSKIKEYLSNRFIIYFNECHKVGLKTKDSINILKNLKNEPLISFIAFHIDEAFLSGEDMVEAMSSKYLDERLKSFIMIAINSSKLNIMLEGYLLQFDKRFEKYTKRISKTIEIISYGLIGIVIIFIYQLLFIPMGMIANF